MLPSIAHFKDIENASTRRQAGFFFPTSWVTFGKPSGFRQVFGLNLDFHLWKSGKFYG
jgi:hypothetical protein